MTDRPVSGRCLCGGVQFELTPPLGEMTHCHCQSCRLSRHLVPLVAGRPLGLMQNMR